MRKFLFLICILLPFAVVNAQTFQRKQQQPGFFIPKSAIPSQQQERLPSIENMNYNQRRPTTYNQKPTVQNATTPQKTFSPAPKNNTVQKQQPALAKAQPQMITQQKKTEKTVAKAPVSDTKTISQTPKKTELFSKPNENYQKDFEQIFNRHRSDLMRISQGDYTQANDITELVDSFKPEIHQLKETIYPRSVIIQ